ncbi:hypothetical protein NQ315_012017 [Exocentrus adspersus]|uniref:Uncharacterized protein n=1 Tax=Exocentrus adspersus TaxID=1586481 RepID=A0AAV8VIB2_9CUCU|nr:hypothetical protein NQ315_012017 [Exocentrus adspersus]
MKSCRQLLDLAVTDQVFVRRDNTKQPLQQPYEGPYKVLRRNERTFVLHINGRDVTVSIHRLKPAYTITEEPTTVTHQENTSVVHTGGTTDVPKTRSGRRVRFPDRFQSGFN